MKNYEIKFQDYELEPEIISEKQYEKLRKKIYSGNNSHLYINEQIHKITSIVSIKKTNKNTKEQIKNESIPKYELKTKKERDKKEREDFENNEWEYITKNLNEIYGKSKWSRFPADYVKDKNIHMITHLDIVEILKVYIIEYPQYKKYYKECKWSSDLGL